MIPNTSTLTEIARNVWESTLGLAILETSVDRTALPAPHLWWAIDIAGDWHGTVLLCVPTDTAKLAAGVIFDRAPDTTTHEDHTDAVAELTNMIGGNIKGHIIGSNRLSLPRHASQPEIDTGLNDANLWFSCPGGEFAVTVVPATHPTASAPPTPSP